MSDAPRPAPPAEFPPLHGAQLFLLTVAIALATVMELLDMTIVNVSIPSISGSLGVSVSEGTWTVSSYMLASAVMQPLTGWLGRRFGEVRSFTTSIMLFVIFSALCGFAVSMPMLVICRIMQGLVSGPLLALGQALLLRNYPSDKRGLALGLWGMVIITAPIFGPILGGYITDNLSWPWLFYINVPVGILSWFLVSRLLKGRESVRVKLPIDVVGLILLVVGVGSLQYTLDNGNDLDWFGSPLIITSSIIAVVSLTFLIPWELTDRHPVVDLHFFGRRNFLIGTLCVSFAYFAFMGANVILPIWLQTTAGYTATWAGIAVAPVGLFALVISPILGGNIHRVNLRWALTFAFALFVGTMYWMSHLNETATLLQLASPRFWQGLGVSFFFLCLNQITLSAVAQDELASATGLSSFMRTISGSISTAVSIWLWNRRTDFHHAVLTEHIRNSAQAWTNMQGDLQSLGITGTGALQYADQMITQQAMTLSFNDMYHVFSIMFIFLIPWIWLAKPPFTVRGSRGAH
jgi:MFS transporter, DHA2 family, multidrug resistance protein